MVTVNTERTAPKANHSAITIAVSANAISAWPEDDPARALQLLVEGHHQRHRLLGGLPYLQMQC